jgi:hypothetical protein
VTHARAPARVALPRTPWEGDTPMYIGIGALVLIIILIILLT